MLARCWEGNLGNGRTVLRDQRVNEDDGDNLVWHLLRRSGDDETAVRVTVQHCICQPFPLENIDDVSVVGKRLMLGVSDATERWSRFFEQNLRVVKWTPAGLRRQRGSA